MEHSPHLHQTHLLHHYYLKYNVTSIEPTEKNKKHYAFICNEEEKDNDGKWLILSKYLSFWGRMSSAVPRVLTERVRTSEVAWASSPCTDEILTPET